MARPRLNCENLKDVDELQRLLSPRFVSRSDWTYASAVFARYERWFYLRLATNV